MCRVAFTTFAAKATYTEILKKIEGKGLDYCCFMNISHLGNLGYISLFILFIIHTANKGCKDYKQQIDCESTLRDFSKKN